MKPLILIIISCVFCVDSAFGIEAESTAVATVNGVPISRAEFEYYIPSRQKLKLPGQTKPSATDGAKQILTDVLNQAVDAKLQQLAAMEAGFISDASYDSFQKEWQNENYRRKQAKKQGKIIYGPTEFTERAYFDYRQSQISIFLRNRFSKNLGEISESKIKATYDSLRESSFGLHDIISLIEVRTKSDSKELLDAIKNSIVNHTIGLLKTKYQCEVIERIVNEQSFQLLSEDRPEYLALAYKLQAGEISDWYPDGNVQFMLQCRERKSGGYLPLDEVREVIRARITDFEYKRYFEGQRSSAAIGVHQRVIDQIIIDLSGKE